MRAEGGPHPSHSSMSSERSGWLFHPKGMSLPLPSWALVSEWKSVSHVRLFVTPWPIQSMESSRPDYQSGQPIPSPADLPDPGIEPRSPALQGDSLPTKLLGKPGSGYIQYPFLSFLTHEGQASLYFWSLLLSTHSLVCFLTLPLKGCCWTNKRHRNSWPPEEKNSIWGQRQGLIAQNFCVRKFY